MLWVYAGADLIRCDQRARMDLPVNTIDVSKTTNIAETLLTIYAHQTPGSIMYLGYIEPILMLTPQDEARLRKVFREFEVVIVVSNPFILPFSWKNGMKTLVVVGQHNVETSSPVDNGSSPHVSDQV